MSPTAWFHTARRRFLGAATRLQAVAPLLTRIALGQALLVAGLGKLRHLERTTAFFEAIGIPLPQVNAAFIGGLETIGGALLILGLGTRLFAFLLSATMVVALVTADRAAFLAALNVGGDPSLTSVTAFVFLAVLLWLLAYGPGAWSVDHAWARRGGAPGDGSR